MVFVLEGLQWGDEGKGKITDYLASHMDIVCRHQGGNNAGHSLVVNGVRYALKSLPSGIINPKIINVIANGCVVNATSVGACITLYFLQSSYNYALSSRLRWSS